MLKRFSAVTVLNGHIHQIIAQREGNSSFATAAATAYPQRRTRNRHPARRPRPAR
jgi:hypothetical protein